jgi:hypothetical protein
MRHEDDETLLPGGHGGGPRLSSEVTNLHRAPIPDQCPPSRLPTEWDQRPTNRSKNASKFHGASTPGPGGRIRMFSFREARAWNHRPLHGNRRGLSRQSAHQSYLAFEEP